MFNRFKKPGGDAPRPVQTTAPVKAPVDAPKPSATPAPAQVAGKPGFAMRRPGAGMAAAPAAVPPPPAPAGR